MIVPFPFAAEPSADLDVGGGPQPSNGSGAHVSVPNGRQETRSLYRKYRPQTFGDDDLVGQEPVVRTLRNALRLDRVAHAYLFCGPRGTGKTTTARLLAKAVNCLDREPDKRPCNVCTNCRAIASGAATDVVEIDAASNRGIDDIRELRERVRYAPAQLRVKFYIVDEAHQITGAAANAFLKTLEEPPDHTNFVLATTDPEELLPTIVSRCQRFDFRRIGLEAMTARLRTVADAERIEATDEALTAIARYATGSLRDALGLLDQLALYRGPAHGGAAPPDNSAAITADAVRSVLGVSRNDRVETLVSALADRDAASALGTVNAAVDAGEDPRQLNRQLVAYLRVLLHQRAGGSPDADDRACTLAARFPLADLALLTKRFGEIDYAIKHSSYGQLPLEVALVEGILRVDPAGATLAFPHRAESAASPPVSPPPAAEPPPRPPATSLRDRVRGVDSGASAPVIATAAPPANPAPSRTAPPGSDPFPVVAEVHGARGVRGGPAELVPEENRLGLDLERLVDLWPRIRQDVKAVNRRIEALLSSIDPAAVVGDRITLAAAYEFHRDKLNTDEVRIVVEEAIERLTGRPVRVACLLHAEVKAAPRMVSPAPSTAEALPTTTSAAPSPATANPATPVVDQPSPFVNDAGAVLNEDRSGDERRIQAAKNIFDAEEIGPPG